MQRFRLSRKVNQSRELAKDSLLRKRTEVPANERTKGQDDDEPDGTERCVVLDPGVALAEDEWAVEGHFVVCVCVCVLVRLELDEV